MFGVSWLHRRARVWSAELPAWCREFKQYPTQLVLSDSVFPTVQTLEGTRLAAVEVFVPRGPKADYGALGAEFIPNSMNSLVVRVPVSAQPRSTPLAESLAGRSDMAWIGLPAEYSRPVLVGALRCGALTLLGSGELTFRCAAHGEVGSSPWVFSKLACVIVQLLAWSEHDATDDEVLALLQRRFDLERNEPYTE